MGNDALNGWDKVFPMNKCQNGWGEIQLENKPIIMFCPHPGYQSINQTNNTQDSLSPSERIIKTLKQANELIVKK